MDLRSAARPTLAQPPAMSASAGGCTCSHCGKTGFGFKRCSRCKQASYCGAECQTVAWKGHKKLCRSQGQGQQLSLDDIRTRILSTDPFVGFAEVLRFESQVDELVSGLDAVSVPPVLTAFAKANVGADKLGKAGPMWGRVGEAFEASGRCEEQVDAMMMAGRCHSNAGDFKACIVWFERARDVSVEHGLELLECTMCSELGGAFKNAGMGSEAEAQLRRGLTGTERILTDASHAQHAGRGADVLQRVILRTLVEVLARKERFEEAESVLLRFRASGGKDAACILWGHFLRGDILANRRDFPAAAGSHTYPGWLRAA